MKRYAVGEPIRGWPVPTWNRIVDHVEGMAADAMRGAFNATGAFAGMPHALVVKVVNKSGANKREFAILGIDDAALTIPDAGSDDAPDWSILQCVALECIAADATDHATKFVVTLQPLAVDAVGDAVILGVTWARIDIGDEDDGYAEIYSGDSTRLQSATSGYARILWKPSGTGLKWCVVELGCVSATILTALVNEASGVVPTDATFDVDGVTVLTGSYSGTTIAGVKNTFEWTIDDNGTVLLLVANNGDVHCIQAECPA